MVYNDMFVRKTALGTVDPRWYVARALPTVVYTLVADELTVPAYRRFHGRSGTSQRNQQ